MKAHGFNLLFLSGAGARRFSAWSVEADKAADAGIE